MTDREKRNRQARENYRKRAQDPEYREKMNEASKKRYKLYYEDPDKRDRIRTKQRERYANGYRMSREKRKEWELNNKESIKEYQKKYRQENKKKLTTQKLMSLHKKIDLVFKAYNNICGCCGEKERKFLTIDHINGRDKERSRKTGLRMYEQVLSEGCPKDRYALLCFNCNCAKDIYGSCPHKVLK
jgi:phosphatidate phosphatase PAH1